MTSLDVAAPGAYTGHFGRPGRGGVMPVPVTPAERLTPPHGQDDRRPALSRSTALALAPTHGQGRVDRSAGVRGEARSAEGQSPYPGVEGAEPLRPAAQPHLVPRDFAPWKEEEIRPPPSQVEVVEPTSESLSRRSAWRRELYDIKVGIAPILWAVRPAIAACGRYAQRNWKDEDDPRNGKIQLVKRAREVEDESGEKSIVWRAGVANVATCKNPHVCPTCANFLRRARADDVNSALAEWGIGRTLMLTMTTRHFADDDPREMLLLWREACKRMFRGRAWDECKSRLAIVGQIRAMEATHGTANGWHVHQHRVLFLEEHVVGSIVNEANIVAFEAWFFERWCKVVGRTFGVRYVPSREHGVRVTKTPEGSYLTKLGLELVDPTQAKMPNSSAERRRTFFQLALDAAHGVVDAMALVKEYATAVRGEKQLHWSPGLKGMFGIGVEKVELDEESTDLEDQPEEIGEDDEETWREHATEGGKIIATVDEREWSSGYARRSSTGVLMAPAVLEALESSDDDATARRAAVVTMRDIIEHGVHAEVASLAEADAQLVAWGRVVRPRDPPTAKRAHRTCNRPRVHVAQAA